jgi:hypothetical protein
VTRVSKARLWGDDGEGLFRRLQAAVEGYMGEMAGLCHARYEELLLEAEGAALVALPSYPEGDDGAEGTEAWDRRMRQDGDVVIPRRLEPWVAGPVWPKMVQTDRFHRCPSSLRLY